MQTNKINQTSNTTIALLLEKFLPQSKEVNEEQLFTGIVASKLSTTKSPEIGELFNKTVSSLMEKAESSKRRVQLEDAAVQALDALVTDKKITKPERDKIYAESFRAAQLDDDHSKIYDSIGGKNDPTMAVQERAKAISSAIDLVKQIDTGAIKAEMPKPSSGINAPTRASNGQPNGFLFKPTSSNSGTVAVLIPAEMGKNAAAVRLVDDQGNVIEQGRFTSFGDTGDRAKYSFSKPGSAYPKGISVEVVLKDGSTSLIPISDPSKRYQ